MMLKNILRFGRTKPDGRIGYSYIADGEDRPMRDAQIGEVVSVEGKGPPWIVVDEAPTTAILARWPGKLWKVSIIEAAAQKDQPYAYARYTRALSVKVLQEERLASLFGEHGDEVLNVLDKAAALDRELAQVLSIARHPEAPAAYDRTFRRWADAERLQVEYDGILDGTLRIGSMPHGSPIYEGLSVLHTVVFERAKAVDGKAATTIDDEDEYLNDPWEGASSVLGDAALALGAPEFVSVEDRGILLHGWRST
jgi:hypothetical protein